MASLKIEGGRALSGRVAVEGNKNSALPLIAACMLTEQPCEIDQRAAHPGRGRAARHHRGARRDGRRARDRHAADPVRARHQRPARSGAGRPAARVGAAARTAARAARLGAARAARRRLSRAPDDLDAPRSARSRLGAEPLDEPGHAMHAPNGLKGASFYLDEASVTGTETALLAAAAADGPSEIRHAAMEPHVVELCEFLQAMGVGIEGAGSSTLRVHPPSRLGPARRIASPATTSKRAAGAVVAAITNGDIEVTGARTQRSRGDRRAAQADGARLLLRQRHASSCVPRS